MAWFYNEPLLFQLIPVSALSLLLLAMEPTRAETASRHMALGKVTLMEMSTQAISVVFMLILALATGSIWALVAGNLMAAGAGGLGLDHAAGHFEPLAPGEKRRARIGALRPLDLL